MIEQLVNEINGLLRDGYPYSALGIALTLPDICGNIAYPNTKVADHYKKWYSEYVNPISALKFKDGFDEEICYKLRCAYLHSPTAPLPVEGWRIPQGLPLKSVGGREQVSLSSALSSRPVCQHRVKGCVDRSASLSITS